MIEIDDDDDSKLKVAILRPAAFDALRVDASTIELSDPALSGAAEPNRSKAKDVDRDGNKDLLLKFSFCDLIGSSALSANTEELVLTGETFDGIPVSGHDQVRIIHGDDDDDGDDADGDYSDEDEDDDD